MKRFQGDPLVGVSYKIKKIDHPDLWDHYVQKNPCSEFSHLFGWSRVIQAVYGHKPIYLAAVGTRGGVDFICGILPLFCFRSMAGGKRLVSLPFVDTAGILADSPEIESMLLQRAMLLMDETGCSALEIRQDVCLSSSATLQGFNFKVVTVKVGLKLELDSSQQKLMSSFRSKLRSQINKAERNNLKTRIGKEELIKPFYEVFSHNMRDLGSPVHSRRFFEAVMENFRDQAFISVVNHGRKTIAAGFMIRFKDEIKNPWASSLRKFRYLNSNMLLYWAMIRFSCNLGLARFDMGRSSRNAATFKFKNQWRPVVRQLYWYQWSRGKDEFKASTFKNERLIFPGLMRIPVPVANIIGPLVRKQISL